MQEDYDSAKSYYGQAIKLDKRYEPAQQNMQRIFELFNFGSSKSPSRWGRSKHSCCSCCSSKVFSWRCSFVFVT